MYDAVHRRQKFDKLILPYHLDAWFIGGSLRQESIDDNFDKIDFMELPISYRLYHCTSVAEQVKSALWWLFIDDVYNYHGSYSVTVKCIF